MSQRHEQQDLGRANPSREIKILRFDEVAHSLGIELSRRRAAAKSGAPIGPEPFLPPLCLDLGGRYESGLHIVHGGPGVGKTAFALQTAQLCKCHALFVTCEMTAQALLLRSVARIAGVNLTDLNSGEQFDEETTEELLAKTVAKLGQLAIVEAKAGATPGVKWLANYALKERERHGHMLIIIDSVHSWAASQPAADGRTSEYEMLSEAAVGLAMLGTESNVAILGVAERNRSQMTEGGLHSVAGSRKFEYVAESMIALGARDGRSGRAGKKSVLIEVVKNRHGPTGQKYVIEFDGRYQSFDAIKDSHGRSQRGTRGGG